MGCSTEIERQEWLESMNEAMDAEIISEELLRLIDVLQGRREVSLNIDNTLKDETENGYSDHPPSPSKNIIVPQPDTQSAEEAVAFSCPPLSMVESPILNSPIKLSPTDRLDMCENGCLDEVTEILNEIQPLLFSTTTNNNNNTKEDDYNELFAQVS